MDDFEKERWLFDEVAGHIGICGFKAAEGFSTFNIGLANVTILWHAATSGF